MPYFLAFS